MYDQGGGAGTGQPAACQHDRRLTRQAAQVQPRGLPQLQTGS